MGEYCFKTLPETYVSQPSSTVLNSKVKKLSFHPTFKDKFNTDTTSTTESTFLACAGDSIKIWDIHCLTHSQLTIQPDYQVPLQTCQWSPLSPHLIVTGGDAGHLHIIDTRVKERQGIVWQAFHAHARPIHDAAFNPFIPYWLASAGYDDLVHIWDLRSVSHQPVGKIDGHQGPITSVTWGNMRPEQLSTTSVDGTYRMWSLSTKQMPLWDTSDSINDDNDRNNDYSVDYNATTFNDHKLNSNNKKNDGSKGRKKKLNYDLNQEESWWASIIEPEAMLNDDQFVLDILEEKEYNTRRDDNKMIPVGALGMGEWGKMFVGQTNDPTSYQKSKGSVIQALVSKTRPGVFYCVTRYGQLCSQKFKYSNNCKLDMIQRYYHHDDPLYYEIDLAIYNRQIELAKSLIDNLKVLPVLNDTQKSFRDEQIEKFNDSLKVLPPISPESWNFNSIPDSNDKRVLKRLWTKIDKWECAVETFKKDLAYWQYRFPPGCDQIYNIPLDTKGQLLSSDSISIESNDYFEPFTPVDATYDDNHAKKTPDDNPYFDPLMNKEDLNQGVYIEPRESISTPISPVSATMTDNQHHNEGIPVHTRKRSNTIGSNFKQKLTLSRTGSLRSLSKRISSGLESPKSASSFELHHYRSSNPSSPLKNKPNLLLNNSIKKSASSSNIDDIIIRSRQLNDYDNTDADDNVSKSSRSPMSMLSPSGSIRRLKKKMNGGSPTGMVISSPVITTNNNDYIGIQLIDHKVNTNNQEEIENEDDDTSSVSSPPPTINTKKHIVSVLPTTPETTNIDSMDATRPSIMSSSSTPEIVGDNKNNKSNRTARPTSTPEINRKRTTLLGPISPTHLQTVNEDYNNSNNKNSHENESSSHNQHHSHHLHQHHGLSRTKSGLFHHPSSVLLAPAKSIKRAFSKRARKKERESMNSNLSKDSNASRSSYNEHHHDNITSETHITPELDKSQSKRAMNL
ncbi:hypothetical protein BJ944DRAFT_263431 [Cunninghamella echinulata]|nr:hypothetical protein BJ944DRAFT_263431 [Cunninghamella echinulata]